MRHFLLNGHRLARLRHMKLTIVMVMMRVERRTSSTTAPAVVARITWDSLYRQVALPAFSVRKPTVTCTLRCKRSWNFLTTQIRWKFHRVIAISIWPWTCVTCNCARLWGKFNQVWPSTTYPCLNYSVFCCRCVMSRCDLDLWPVDLESSWYVKQLLHRTSDCHSSFTTGTLSGPFYIKTYRREQKNWTIFKRTRKFPSNFGSHL